MGESIYTKVIQALQQAENHNSNLMVKPEVILWPDPENQWIDVIAVLQENMPQLLLYGSFEPAKKQGPAIWLKCMVARTLPEANWVPEAIPIIYLPGVSKTDLRNVENAVFSLQPLLEYQYTGTVFLQENGREWSILAFVENPGYGLGIKVAKGSATKEALKKALPTIFQDAFIFAGKESIDADFLNNQLFPDIIPTILKWICKGDAYLQCMDNGKREVFKSLCKSQYDFEPDHKNILEIVKMLGAQRGSWKYVWQLYAAAPQKYPEIEELLRQAKPTDMGSGLFAYPDESWPQVNEDEELYLTKEIKKAAKKDKGDALLLLEQLEKKHGVRRSWVWGELGNTAMANALLFLEKMAKLSLESFPIGTIDELKSYYLSQGYQIDQNMRKALASVKTADNKDVVKSVIQLFYMPWLEKITNKFQELVAKDASIFTSQKAKEETESFILFVDAFRYELADEFIKSLSKTQWKITVDTSWTAIPSLTPTSKPNVSPIAGFVSHESEISDFRPKLKNGKDLQISAFREAMKSNNFICVSSNADIRGDGKYWQEIGNIDTKGHEEQAEMVKRVNELFEQVREAIDVAFDKGIKRIKIVTDHGWLLLPGGLPKTQLNAGLAETRWGRCALIKDGVKSDLLHLPWRWNPSIFIAYAPGINFFKANQEYAHGGISIHECLVPEIIIENTAVKSIEAEINDVKWVNLKCTISTSELPDGYSVDIRSKFNDEKSSIVLSRSKLLKDNEVTLMVDDAAEYQAATIVLLDENERIITKKPTTVGG